MYATRLQRPLDEAKRRACLLHVGTCLVVLGVLGCGAVLAQGPTPSPAVAAAQAGQEEFSSSQPVAVSYGAPGIRVIVPENTLIRVTTDASLNTKRSKVGTPVSFTISEDVIVNHLLAIPRGVTVHGRVVENKKAGVVRGSPELTLKLDSLDSGGESCPLYAYQFKVTGASREKPVERGVVDGAYYGALAGGVVAGRTSASLTRRTEAEDMGAGAAAGAGAVAAASLTAPRPVVAIPAESQMDFYLASPISVQPVSQKEAERLSHRLHPGSPVLYVRGDTP